MSFANRSRRGFTLLELLVVMVIIGLLASYVAPKYFGQIGKSEIKTTQAQIEIRDLREMLAGEHHQLLFTSSTLGRVSQGTRPNAFGASFYAATGSIC